MLHVEKMIYLTNVARGAMYIPSFKAWRLSFTALNLNSCLREPKRAWVEPLNSMNVEDMENKTIVYRNAENLVVFDS